MTETNTALAEAIVTCGAIRAKLEVLQDMLTPKPVLTIESITRPDHDWELYRPADLDCPEGTVIEATDGYRYYRLGPGRAGDWVSDTGRTCSHNSLWNSLIQDAAQDVEFAYSGSF